MSNHHTHTIRGLRTAIDQLPKGGQVDGGDHHTLAQAIVILERQPCRHVVMSAPDPTAQVAKCDHCGAKMHREWVPA